MPELVGLANVGNTCAINALIQCIRASRRLCDSLAESIKNRSEATSTGAQLLNIFDMMEKAPSNAVVRPFGFMEHIKTKYGGSFVIGQPHDISELWVILCDGIAIECKSPPPTIEIDDISIIDTSIPEITQKILIRNHWEWLQKVGGLWSPWGHTTHGMFVNQIICNGCGQSSITFQLFSSIDVEIRENVKECMESHFSGEEMTEWKCEKCGNVGGRRAVRITRSPDVLVIVFKRYEIAANGHLQKKGAPIDVTDHLNITPWIYGHVGSTEYALVAVGNQYGSMNGGHYVATVMTTAAAAAAFVIDDTSIVKVPYENRKQVTANAYIAFYEKIKEP